MKESKDPPTIRAATSQDADKLAKLMSMFDNETVTVTQAKERLLTLGGIETAILAEKGTNIVALACLRVAKILFSNKPHAEIIEFYIKEEHRDGQIEHLLLERIETLAKQRGAIQITLLTGLKNADAQSAYRTCGYQDYALAMRKHLFSNN